MAYEISTSIKIAATPENVWTVLADLDNYPRWHPSFQSVTGQLAVGSTLTISTTSPATGNPITLKVKVLAVEADIELAWASKLLGMTIIKRQFLLHSARRRHRADAGRDLPGTRRLPWARRRPGRPQDDRQPPGQLHGDQRGHQKASRGPAAAERYIVTGQELSAGGQCGWALNAPATHPGCDGRGHHRGLGHRRAAGCHGAGYDRGLRDWRADDADSSCTCWPQWHCQSPAVAVASSASIAAMMA